MEHEFERGPGAAPPRYEGKDMLPSTAEVERRKTVDRLTAGTRDRIGANLQ
jgi:hypothetical protein